MQPPPPWFTDDEVDAMCEGLTQDAAKVRFLQRLGLKVDRKPNGKPLAWRPAAGPGQPEAQNATPGLNVIGMDQWYAARRAQRGQKTQGR